MVSQQEDKSASFHYSAINNHSLHGLTKQQERGKYEEDKGDEDNTNGAVLIFSSHPVCSKMSLLFDTTSFGCGNGTRRTQESI